MLSKCKQEIYIVQVEELIFQTCSVQNQKMPLLSDVFGSPVFGKSLGNRRIVSYVWSFLGRILPHGFHTSGIRQMCITPRSLGGFLSYNPIKYSNGIL